ncbi:hypothetical protein HPS36_00810 [Halorubrum salinarum]|uniref:Uncharacterized protein n=1 Tax=Halorubrum salinarum TaxID=2739057 RepID=A0A7D3XYP2_9EURY|nr:hypothetical protein [Halorubrum salinarum]QKG91452.1 hypothetical protein HPS36_00810 [Halorubrum salinarum]
MTDRDASPDERDGEDGETREGDEPDDAGHLDDVPDGAGCTEIWERLSERREE